MAEYQASTMALASLVSCAVPKLMHWDWAPADLVKLFIGVFFTQFLARSLWRVFIYPTFFSPLRHLPSPKGGHWLFGHGMKARKYGPGVLARQWMTEVQHDGIIRMLWHFNREFLLILSPAALSEVLVTKSYVFEKPLFARKFLAYIIGWGLLTVEGDEHKVQRRNLMPAFSFRHIKDLYPTFWQKSREGALKMSEVCDPATGCGEIEVGSWAGRCALDIIGLAGIGRDFGAIQDETNPLVKSYNGLNPTEDDTLLVGMWAFLPDWAVRNAPLKRRQGLAASAKHLREVCIDLVHEKKRKLFNKESAGLDILTVAMSSGMFSDENLVDQMLTFLSAGHDTTAASLTWAVYTLCRFPKVQERLRAEIREHLPPLDNDTPLSSNDIDSLPYLNAFCNEVMRTNAPVAQTMRVATEATTIQGQVVPKGTILILAPWANNTDPQLWGPDAREFKPERWLTPEQGGTSSSKSAASGGATSNYAMMTFIHGPRSCIGGSFARSEFACLVAAWAGRFSFELKDKSLMDERNVRVAPSVVAKPVGGLNVLIRKIDGF